MINLTTILLGSGFALFVALLAWGNQIRNPRKEIRRLEEIFRDEFKLTKEETTPLLRDFYDSMKKTTRYSFIDQTMALMQIMSKKKLSKKRVELLNAFTRLHDMRKELEFLYNNRYLLSVITTIILFILGSCSIFLSLVESPINGFIFDMNFLYLLIVFDMIGFVILNLLISYKKEQFFVWELTSTYDILEAR